MRVKNKPGFIHSLFLSILEKRVREFFGPQARLELSPHLKGKIHADATLQAGSIRFVVELKSSATLAEVILGASALQELRLGIPDALPLLVVPYMSEAGREFCAKMDISWLDLSGNANIRAPGLLIRVAGEKNLFTLRGRPSSPFAPKSARVARQFLEHSRSAVTQRQLAYASGMNEGTVSKLVRRLLDLGLLTRHENGLLTVRDPMVLLDAWRDEYDFGKHRCLSGVIPAKSGPEALHLIAKSAHDWNIEYAATGLAAAWQMNHHSMYRLVSVYMERFPKESQLQDLGFYETKRGANIWLLLPNDKSVFYGSYELDGIRCVSPIQVYLDLKGHPERSGEAAEELKKILEERFLGG